MSEAEPSSEVRDVPGAIRARDPLLGRIVGVYRIRERVGEGTGLPAYLAEHVHLDRTVLFKLFHPPRDGGEAESVRRAIQQARELSALKHEGVLPLVEIAECGDGFMYVVLELSGGRPLPALLAEGGPLPWSKARSLGRQVAEAMLAADAVSLASTEPAASQIFVSKSAAGELRARVDLVTPEALGWVPARSPDQARAVGHLLYTMLAGQEPATATESPPDLVLSFPDHDIPSEADALVMRAVDAERSRRWPDLRTLHRELGGRDEPSTEAGEGGGVPRAIGQRDGLVGAEDDDSRDDATFGRRFFAPPSKRALIAGGVGVAVAILLALAIVSGPSDSDSVTFQSAEGSKLELTPAPAPTPVVVPPPVPDPEPGSPEGLGGAAALEGVVAAQGGAAEAKAEGAPPGLAEAAPVPAVAAPAPAAAVPAPAPAVAAPAPVVAAPSAAARPITPPVTAPAPEAPVPPAPATTLRGVRSAPGRAATPALSPSPPPAGLQKAAAAPVAVAALSPASAASAAVPPAPIAAGDSAPVTDDVAAAAPSARTAGPGTAPPAAAGSKEGGAQLCTLSLGSIPWSDVQVDGQRAGFTPLTDLPIACGTHEILFISPERGLERRITLTLRPGEKLKRIVDLGGPKAQPGPPGAAVPARPACRVTLGSRPWSEIWIDGQRAGTTPLVDYPIACGTHDVLFLSREANVQHRESLNVQSTLKKVITLVEATE